MPKLPPKKKQQRPRVEIWPTVDRLIINLLFLYHIVTKQDGIQEVNFKNSCLCETGKVAVSVRAISSDGP